MTHSYKSWTLSVGDACLDEIQMGILFLAEAGMQSKDPDCLCTWVHLGSSVSSIEIQAGSPQKVKDTQIEM